MFSRILCDTELDKRRDDYKKSRFGAMPFSGSPDSIADTHLANYSAMSSYDSAGFAANQQLRIAIAGGGAAGVGTALELAKAGYKVDLYEKGKALLSATSNKTPGRAGHGYHYIHKETSKLYLKATIEVIKRYPDCLIGHGQPATHYLRHGLYCIMKQKNELPEALSQFSSIYPKEKILENYSFIKEYYRELVAEDPSNEIFGPPDDFYKILSEAEKETYRESINFDIVDTIIDTREELLNWPKLRLKLIDEVTTHPNIAVHLRSTIDNPEQKSKGLGFAFKVNGKNEDADIFINATWERIEALNQKISVHMEPESRTNRLKTILTLELPKHLQEHPSVFFCMGPHAMVSNMGNGKVMSTYAQVTNVSSSTGLSLSREASDCLDGKVDFSEEMKAANAIIDGVSQYFPPMSKARLIDKNYGVIKTRGTVDLFDPASAVNKREEIGVEEQLVGWIDNACMKLLHFVFNGKEVLELVKQTERAQVHIRALSAAVISEIFLDKELFSTKSDNERNTCIDILKNMLLTMLQRYTSASVFEPTAKEPSGKIVLNCMYPSLFNSMKVKENAMKMLKNESEIKSHSDSMCVI